MLTRYLDAETTRADACIVHLVREAREAVTDPNHSRSTDAFQAGSIFTGQRGRPKYTSNDIQVIKHSRRRLSNVRFWVLVNERATWSVSYYLLAASKLVPRTWRSSPRFLRKREATRSPSQSSADQQSYEKVQAS